MVTNYAIYENNEQISHENNVTEPVHPIHMNFYQSYIYRKDLSWLHFYNGPRVQKRHQELNQQANIPFSETFLAYLIGS